MDSQVVAPTQNKGKYLVSVIITTHNRSKYLREAIESVLVVKNLQNPKFDIELIVVDDGSTDDTPEVIRNYPVKHITTTGVGMAHARNTGLRAATGDFVTLLDDDDVWMPNNIAPHIELFEQRPELGAVHAQFQLVHHNMVPYGPPNPPGPYTSGWIFEELLSYWPQVGTILTRAEVAREAGEFDPTLTGDNDWDWLLRVAKRHPIGRIEQPVLWFRQRDKAEEQLAWRRFPALPKIFQRHTKPLGFWKWLRLQPILWRQRGWWTMNFLNYARMNFARGDRRRGYRSLYYAFRCSPPHALRHCLKAWPRRPDAQMTPALSDDVRS